MMQWLGWGVTVVLAGLVGVVVSRLRGARADATRLQENCAQQALELDQLRQQQPRLEHLARRASAAEVFDATGAAIESGLKEMGLQIDQACEGLAEYRQLVSAYDAAVQICLQPVEMIFGADKAALDQLIKHVEDARRALFIARSELEKSRGLVQANVLLEESTDNLATLGELAHGLHMVAAVASGERDWFDFNDAVDDVLCLVAPLTVARIEVVRALGQLPRIHGERAELTRAVFNLVQNALQAMPQAGRLAVTTRANGMQGIELEVVDTGEGVEEEDLGRIFDPFYSSRDASAHVGLGLPVARAIIKEHGGSIRVRSASNSGTTFSVSLPLQRKQAINDGSSS
ncbi:MAG: ATP-binding protein [Dokdonella sp.]